MVGELLGKNERIADSSLSALLSFGQICLELALVAVEDVAGAKHGVKSAVAVEANCLAASVGVPIADAIGVDLARAVPHTEANRELIAIAAVVDTVEPGVIPERAALAEYLVLLEIASEGVERMDVLHKLRGCKYLKSELNARDTHIGKAIVRALDKHADRAFLAVAHDIYVKNVSIRGVRVCAVLDVDAHEGILDRDLLNKRLASRVDGNSLCNSASVDDTAEDAVVASVYSDVVEGLCRAETNHSLVAIPRVSRLESCELGKLKIYRVSSVCGSADRLRKDIFTVGEIYRSVRIFVDDLLYRVGYVDTCVSLDIIGNYYVASVLHHSILLTFIFILLFLRDTAYRSRR